VQPSGISHYVALLRELIGQADAPHLLSDTLDAVV
jgi:hypothetical protein